MEEFVQPRRKPARDRKISEIKIGDDYVRIIGVVLSRKEAEIVLDDGSGRITVFVDDPSLLADVNIGSRVRVFGIPLSVNGASELRAEIVQKVDMLDRQLLDEVRLEIKKLDAEIGRR